MKNKQCYEFDSSNKCGCYSVDFFVKINNVIYICSHMFYQHEEINVLVAYNIGKNNFEIDTNDETIIPDNDYDIIYECYNKL